MKADKVPVSVIIPCYKCSPTLGRAINSVVSQSVLPSEVIVVIDGDGGEKIDEILLQAKERLGSSGIKFKVIQLPHNVGPGGARNRGWDQATEDYVAFLDADDVWHPDKLAKQVLLMVERNMSFTAHGMSVLDSEKQSLPEVINSNLTVKRFSAWALLLGNKISTPTVVIRRTILHRFKEDGLAEDYYLWLKLVLTGTELHFLNADLAFMFKARWGEAGMSAKLWRMEKGELDTLWRLSYEGLYSRILFPILAIWSFAKFVRRLVLWGLRRVLG